MSWINYLCSFWISNNDTKVSARASRKLKISIWINRIYLRMQNGERWHLAMTPDPSVDSDILCYFVTLTRNFCKKNCVNSYYYRPGNALESRGGQKHHFTSPFQHYRVLSRCSATLFDSLLVVDWMFVPPSHSQINIWSSNAQCDSNWRWSLWESSLTTSCKA